MTNKEKAEEHKKFWKREKTKVPLVSYNIGSYFPAANFPAAKNLLVKGKKITPEMLDVDSFLADYEAHYKQVEELGQSGFWTAEPYPGIPWIEAFWGCEIVAEKESFTAKRQVEEPAGLEKLSFQPDGAWFKKFMEFVEKLSKLSEGRWTVGAPIIRGAADTLGALMGQTELIYALYEEPDIIKATLRRIVDSFLTIYSELHKRIQPIEGGTATGFYDLWAPGKTLWFQDDLSALFSPDLFREFLLPNECYFCGHYPYTLMHMHPSSFHMLDAILDNENLGVVEINKDVAGPSVADMCVQYRKIIEKGKRVMVWGDLTVDDVKAIYNAFASDDGNPAGFFFNPWLPTMDRAKELQAFFETKKAS
jgi:hypothetical protein